MTRPGPAAAARPPEQALVTILAEAGTLRDAAPRLLELVAGAFGWAAGVLWLVDPETDLLRWAEDWSEDDPALAEFRRVARSLTFTRDAGVPGRVWTSGEPAWLGDLSTDPHFLRGKAARRAGLASAVVLPVIAPEGVLGVMEFFARAFREPDAEQLELMRTVGRQVGQYVARTRYEGLLRRSEERSTAIVAAALDCVVTMDHRGRVVDFNPAAEATFGCRRADALGRDLAELIIPPALRTAHHRALRRYVDTGKPTIIGRRLELTAQRADGTPLPVELTVTRLGSGEPPTFAGFVRDLSDRRRAEDELARLLQREHEARLRAERAEQAARQVADALQRSLLPPHLPPIPGVELGAAYRAGGEGMTVGGDFYDVFDLGEGRWGVAIGDVRGKGAGAASVTALARYTIRAAAVREPRPAAVLRALNEALIREAPDGGQFCTVIYAALDARPPAAPRLSLAVGGHPPPLLLDAGGRVTPVGRRGTLVGALPDPLLQDSELLLGAGDLLLLYTDGVTESRTPVGRFGIDRLAGVLARCAGLPAGAVVARVQAAVADAPGHQTLDDVALLALRATG